MAGNSIRVSVLDQIHKFSPQTAGGESEGDNGGLVYWYKVLSSM